MTAVAEPTAEQARIQRLRSAPPAVEMDHVFKTFRLPRQRYSTLKERALHPLRSMIYDDLEALKDVHVTIPQGEFFGIVGRNGSGKSSLLKVLAGIYRPEQGRVAVHGRLSPFIELGVGFNPDLPARDNVVINAVMMGLSRREARKRFDDVLAFAELEEFVDLKLKNYSSGMAVRLGFATAIQVDADVLLVDEVLAVGDAAFQQKCFEEFTRMKSEGKTIVFVTHDMFAVERFCDRAMLLERGDVLQIGEPHEISRAYNELNFGRLVHDAPSEEARYGDHQACEITDGWFERDGERIGESPQLEPLTMAFKVRFHADVDDPVFGLSLRNEIGHTIFNWTTEWAETPPAGRFAAGDEVIVRATTDTVLAPSKYLLTPSVAREGYGADALDLREDLASVYVHGPRVTGGIIEPPLSFSLDRR
ncbi:ABC transporter [Baekduia alba]|uniref:ABC transporter ATP-binding protein n=1 Tax=Baekduia alba TaxID=2997333 RepID=UPI002340CA72|nr:ABC transporter ATP-binding protein [Baekduia alba]WCB96575.1 ABC transporter [Baekduia alba]